MSVPASKAMWVDLHSEKIVVDLLRSFDKKWPEDAHAPDDVRGVVQSSIGTLVGIEEHRDRLAFVVLDDLRPVMRELIETYVTAAVLQMQSATVSPTPESGADPLS